MTTSSNDYYELLGLNKGANEADIKSAYKKAARKYHPDNSETGNEELFKKIGEAYETLKDPQKKAIYDQYGAEGLKGFGGGGASGFSSGGAAFEDLSDILSSFFGGSGFSGGGGGRRSRSSRASRGQDHSVDVTLDFLDPKEKISKKIKINPLVECQTCHGQGHDKAEDKVTCSTCAGQGQVYTVQNTILGQMRSTTTCPACGGLGEIIKNPCKPCKGKGYKREDKELEITIPPGVYDGATMRLGAVGDAGRNGGPPGDIYLNIRIKTHPKFKREDADIFSQAKIGLADAALGIKLEVPTINGTKTIEIKPGTQSGEIYTLKGDGMPKLNNPNRHGDHYLTIQVITPKNLSGKEKDLLKELQTLRSNRDIEV